jgi:deazaflavin-dependent oxidoreductase (nitroreductase family)
MPLPRSLARFNRRVTNRVFRIFAGRVPGVAVVVHRGRSTGREYRTPVSAFKRSGGGFTIALFYGQSQWARNVLANGGCDLEVVGRRLAMTNPRVVHDPTRRAVPAPVRPILRLIDVDDFIQLDPAPRA